MLKHLLKHLPQGKTAVTARSAYSPHTLDVTALIRACGLASYTSTGIAAVPLSGHTIFHWAGIGDGTKSLSDLVTKICRNRTTLARWQQARTLLIGRVCCVLVSECFCIWIGQGVGARRNFHAGVRSIRSARGSSKEAQKQQAILWGHSTGADTMMFPNTTLFALTVCEFGDRS